MRRALRTLSASLSVGFAFFYFSELVFWARPCPEDNLLNWLETWLAYSAMAFLFLAVARHFRVRSLLALFLSGAFFGWLAEGVIVQTAYESLPLSISFTGLAWHALITVVLGWYGLQSALRRGLRASLLTSAGLGLFFGFWGVCWIYEEPGTVVPPLTFGLYALISSGLLALSLAVAAPIFRQPFRPSRWSVGIMAGLFLLYFAGISVPAAPIAALILPLLMLLLYLGLRRNRQSESGGDVLEILARPIPPRHLPALLLIPAVAALFYGLYWLSGLRLPTHWAVYILVTPAGFGLLGWSLWKVFRGKSNPTTQQEE